MAKLDSAKEELGWLQVLFAVFVAIDASLIPWVSQAHETAKSYLTALAIVGIAAFTATAIWINRSAYRKIRELERF